MTNQIYSPEFGNKLLQTAIQIVVNSRVWRFLYSKLHESPTFVSLFYDLACIEHLHDPFYMLKCKYPTGNLLSAAERRSTPVLLSATVSDNFGNSPQVAAPRRPREIDQSTQRCSRLDPSFNRSVQIHALSCTKQKYWAIN